jgi:S1-C subfamily serine protease
MESRGGGFRILAAMGCGGLIVLVIAVVAIFAFLMPDRQFAERQPAQNNVAQATLSPDLVETQVAVPTLTTDGIEIDDSPSPAAFNVLYSQLNPGVVNIQVFAQQAGGAGVGAGSGFVIDEEGYIVTNDHVIAGADFVTVVFYNGLQAPAEIIGGDPHSDLAVIRVADLPDDVHPLNLGDSNTVQVGEWVVAIGNPFGLGSSLTVGVVSAIGRTIPGGATPFGIPHAIQTDAAINPGNSGGPLLNMEGEVIGVNAMIATDGMGGANVGVGFAIPVSIVRRAVPGIIETGTYGWPWLGIQGDSVNYFIDQANNLGTQRGAYVDAVVGGPAAEAGLQGTSSTTTVEGFSGVPVGGDVIIEFNGEPVADYSDLQLMTILQDVGETITLTILRNGEPLEVDLELQPRPVTEQ